jgi:hypothetical protein
MKPMTIAVAALAGPPVILGRIYPREQFADAILLAAQAKAAGYDGTIYCAMDDGSFAIFNTVTKSFAPIVAWPF